MSNFYSTVNEAVADIEKNGFDSIERLSMWEERIRASALNLMMPENQMQLALANALRSVYAREVDRGGALKKNKGVKPFTLDMIKPKLRAELDRRIMASAQLIKLNREQSIAKTLQRFSGWATSIPAGGSDAVSDKDVKIDVKKALKSLTFNERRVLVDQSNKFSASINNILATDGGAIAAIWHSHHKSMNYDARPAHAARDGEMFAIRDSWAHKEGLIHGGKYGFTDEIEMVGEFCFCRCRYEYIYDLADVDTDLLTEKGKIEVSTIYRDK